MFCDNTASKQEKVSTGESVLMVVVFMEYLLTWRYILQKFEAAKYHWSETRVKVFLVVRGTVM